MTSKDWDERFSFWLKYALKESHAGRSQSDMREVWARARQLTEHHAGPRPAGDGDGVLGKIGGVVMAPVKGVKKMANVIQGIQKVVQFLNGKKTAIGALLAVVADGIQAILPVLPGLLEGFGIEAAFVLQVVSVLGKVLAVIGLVHKVIKYRRNGNVR